MAATLYTSSLGGTWHKWVLNRISTAVSIQFMEQLQYHAHAYVHCVCSHPIRLGNRLRGYNMIGYGGYQVNAILTTAFRTLEEKNDWDLLLLTHWRLLPSWILLFSFHHLPFASISLGYFPCSWSHQICTCAVAKKAAPSLTLPISGLILQLQVTKEPGNEVPWHHHQISSSCSILHSMYP